MNANPDLVFRMKFDGTILEVHTSEPDLLIEKLDPSTTEGNNMKDLVSPRLFSKWEKSRDAYLKTGKTQSYEYELNVRKGLCFFLGSLNRMRRRRILCRHKGYQFPKKSRAEIDCQ